jgi:hypothetical protein
MPERFGEMLEKALAGTLFASRWLLARSISGLCSASSFTAYS